MHFEASKIFKGTIQITSMQKAHMKKTENLTATSDFLENIDIYWEYSDFRICWPTFFFCTANFFVTMNSMLAFPNPRLK